MLKFFQSEEDEKLRSHFQNLIALAKIDGDIDKAELNMLYKVGYKYDYSKKDVNDLVSKTEGGQVFVPESDEDKFNQFYDLVQLMLGDGIIEDHEMKYCGEMAMRIGIPREVLSVLIRRITFGIVEGLDRSVIKQRVSAFLNFGADQMPSSVPNT